MLGQCDLIGFVATADAVRAKTFYVDVLGLEFVSDDGFALVVRANGLMVRVVKMAGATPVPYTVLGWEVPDVEKMVKELAGVGVEFVRYPYFVQDELGIWTAPSGSRVAWFKDPDGNVLSLSQH